MNREQLVARSLAQAAVLGPRMRTKDKYDRDTDGDLGSNRGMTVGRNKPCPCKSGKKFKNCCINGKKLKVPDQASE